MEERETLIRRLQDVAKARNMRVTFISGDVHVGGLGRLYSHPKLDLRKDFRFMPQASPQISSPSKPACRQRGAPLCATKSAPMEHRPRALPSRRS